MKEWLSEVQSRIKSVKKRQNHNGWFNHNVYGWSREQIWLDVTPNVSKVEDEEYAANRLADLLQTYVTKTWGIDAPVVDKMITYYLTDPMLAQLFFRQLELIKVYNPEKTYSADAVKEFKAILPKNVFEAMEIKQKGDATAPDTTGAEAAAQTDTTVLYDDDNTNYILIFIAVLVLLWILG